MWLAFGINNNLELGEELDPHAGIFQWHMSILPFHHQYSDGYLSAAEGGSPMLPEKHRLLRKPFPDDVGRQGSPRSNQLSSDPARRGPSDTLGTSIESSPREGLDEAIRSNLHLGWNRVHPGDLGLPDHCVGS